MVKYLLLGVILAGVLFFRLGEPLLWDRDEPRNAGCAREMLQRGDWIVPTFNGELRTHKPILLYWFLLAAYQLAGVSEFTARLPSALLASGTVLLTLAMGRRLFGEAAGFWSAAILATFVMFGVIGRAATPDAALLFFTTAALSVFVHAAWQPGRTPPAAGLLRPATGPRFPFPSSWLTAALIYGSMGVAVLAKGPVGAVLPTAILGLFCLLTRLPAGPERGGPGGRHSEGRGAGWRHRCRALCVTLLRPLRPRHFLATCVALRPLLALTAIGLVSLPWYLAVGVRTDGVWLREFVGEHNLGRALHPMEGHAGSLFYYPLVLLVCCFPWSVFTIPAGSAVREALQPAGQSRSATVFLLCWLGVTVGLFSLAQTKLPSYVAPAYPAVAMLLGYYAARVTREADAWDLTWLRIGMLTLVGVGLAGALALLLLAGRYLPGESAVAWIGLVPAAGGAVGWWLVSRQQTIWALRSALVSAVLFSLLLFGVLAVRVSRHQESPQLLAQVRCPAPGPLVAYGRLEPSWVYYARQPIRFYPPQEWRGLSDFLVGNPQSMLMVPARSYAELRGKLPLDLQVMGSVPYFLRRDALLLLARPGQEITGPDAVRRPRLSFNSSKVH